MFDLQKKSNFYKMRLRNIDREVEPIFSTLLLAVCAFMAVILIGAGSVFGGIVFLAPLAVAAHAYWDQRCGRPADEA